MTTTNETKQKPSYEVKLGRIKAVVWRNETSEGSPRYNTQIRRLYKKDDQRHESDSFGRDDLPLIHKVSDLVHTWIYEQGSSVQATSS
jgi:hypothetical protein